MSNALEEIIKKYKHQNVLIVCHGVVLKALISYIENKPINKFWEGEYMRSTCLNILEINDKHKYFSIKGDISHYPNDFKHFE